MTPSDWITLRNDALVAQVDPQGAQLSVLRDAQGRDLLWDGDPAVWKGRAPILFPIVGALNGGHYRWHGQHYPLSRHGFARERRFTVMRKDPRETVLWLAGTAETLKVYPFEFNLGVRFRLEDVALDIQAVVHNNGKEAMPASLGFHPAFRWPLPYGTARGEHYIEFEKEERAPIRRLDAQGLLMAASHHTPVRDRRLMLDDALFADDVVIFDRLASRSLTYGTATGPRIKVSFPNATHLGLWSKPGAGFVCIEPWRGLADPAGFEGEFSEKPGVFDVPPDGSEALVMRVEVVAAGGARPASAYARRRIL
jgi:galactose mutarotase-like enzyme